MAIAWAMIQFLRFAFLYNVAAMVISVLMRGGETAHIAASVQMFLGVVPARPDIIIGLALSICLALVLRRDVAVLRDAAAAIAGLLLLQSGFTMFKGSMALAGAFWADPMLATLDQTLHFGYDPWMLTHRLADLIDPRLASEIYVQIWLAVAFGFPVVLAVLDRDIQRRNRFLILYCMAWIVVGNLMAYTFLSAGPIYFEEFHGGTRFAALHDALAETGIEQSVTGVLHDLLLRQLYEGNMIMGTGISAFPSVHVAVSAVVALYVIEAFRSWIASALAVTFLGTILFLSVYLGWHYAVDGYASIAVIFGAWAMLKRAPFANWARSLRSAAGIQAPDPDLPRPM